MANLLLSGGGIKADVKLVKMMLSLIPKNSRILYIPVAMPTTKYSSGECYDWLIKNFGRYGLKNVDMWTEISNRKYEELAKYPAIFIGGGYMFDLWNMVRKTHFDRLLIKYAKVGHLIYGGSAGAILLGKEIGTSYLVGNYKTHIAEKRYNGLNIVNGYSIACHYKRNTEKYAIKYSLKTGIPVIALPNETGLHVKGKRMTVIGSGSAILFRGKNKKVLKAGSAV